MYDGVPSVSQIEKESATQISGEAKSAYGLRNHFFVPNDLKAIAKRYGITVKGKRDGLRRTPQFEISSIHGDEALDKLITPFIQDGNKVLSRKDLRSFLSFLKQPVGQTLPKHQRLLGHGLTRFATTGLTEIPEFVDEKLQDAKSLECHEKGERKMKEDDVWSSEAEFWNAKEDEDIVSAIPGTSYDPERGFVLQIDAKLQNPSLFEGENQQQLAGAFWNLVDEATNGRYQGQRPDEIAFTAQELKTFYNLAPQHNDFALGLKMAQIEEKTQARLANIQSNAAALKTDLRFQTALSQKGFGVSPRDKLDNIAAATSALTPIISSEVMFDAWRHSHFTERLMGLSDPLNRIMEEYAVVQMTLAKLHETGLDSPAELQAVINEFRPLFSFSAELAASVETASAQKKKHLKRYGEGALSDLTQNAKELQSIFEQASVNGTSSAEHDAHYEEVLNSVRNVFGQNGNIVTQQAVGYVDMMKGFWVSAARSAADNPAVFAMIAGFIGYAYQMKYGMDAQLNLESADTIMSTVQASVDPDSASNNGYWGDGAVTGDISTQPFSAEELASFERIGEAEVKEAIKNGADWCTMQSFCHYNTLLPPIIMDRLDPAVSGYLKFRHIVGAEIIAGNAMKVQSLAPQGLEALYTSVNIPVDDSSTWVSVSESTTHTTGKLIVDANMFQDGSHATMLGYGSARVAARGPVAFKQMGSLASEFINPVARLGSAPLGFAKRTALQGTAMGLMLSRMHDTSSKVASKITPPARLSQRLMDVCVHNKSPAHPFALEDNAQESNTSERALSNFIPAKISLGMWAYGAWKKKIEITGQNITALKGGLNTLALTLDYSANDVGISRDKYKEFLKQALISVEEALESYQTAPTSENKALLQKALDGNLQHLIGAELQYCNSDEIYTALFPKKSAAIDIRRRGVFKRHAEKKEGRIGRSDFRKDVFNKALHPQNRAAKPEKIASLQSLKYLGGGALGGFRSAKSGLAGVFSYAGDAVVFVAREGIQEPISQLPAKKRLAQTFLAVSTIGLGADMIAGVDSSVVSAAASAGAAASSAAISGVIGAMLNLPQDLMLHTAAVGFSGAALGLPYYYGVKRGAYPMGSAFKEKATGLKDSLSRIRKKPPHQSENPLEARL